MTKEEIQALIDAKIAGQGSAVDVGGALPAILSEILELASAESQPHVLEVLGTLDSGTTEEVLSLLKLDGETPTVEQFRNINFTDTIVKFIPVDNPNVVINMGINAKRDGEDGSTLFCGHYDSEDSEYSMQIIVSQEYNNITYIEL